MGGEGERTGRGNRMGEKRRGERRERKGKGGGEEEEGHGREWYLASS